MNKQELYKMIDKIGDDIVEFKDKLEREEGYENTSLYHFTCTMKEACDNIQAELEE